MSEPTRTTESTPPRLSTRSVPSFTCAGTRNHAIANAANAIGTVTRNTEPHQKCSSNVPDSNGPSDANAAPMADHNAIVRNSHILSLWPPWAQRRERGPDGRPQRDRLRAGRTTPQRCDQRQRGRVAHAARHPAQDPRADEEVRTGRVGGEEAQGNGERGADQQHLLAAIPVAHRAQVEHRCGKSQAVPDRDQVQLRLRRVEVLPDRRQRHVGDRQVQVGHRRGQDQRDQHQRRAVRAVGRGRRLGRTRHRSLPTSSISSISSISSTRRISTISMPRRPSRSSTSSNAAWSTSTQPNVVSPTPRWRSLQIAFRRGSTPRAGWCATMRR